MVFDRKAYMKAYMKDRAALIRGRSEMLLEMSVDDLLAFVRRKKEI